MKNNNYKNIIPFLACLLFSCIASLRVSAQVGDYRNDFAIGVNGAYTMASVGFAPSVSQSSHTGKSFGVTMRYTSEKYFKTICSLVAEVNYSELGWKQDILTINKQPVLIPETDTPEHYQRNINYLQVPLMAHLAWGREEKGFQFFFQAGPQFGYMLSEETSCNYTPGNGNMTDRANQTIAQETMPVENKIDYGICAGLGVEGVMPHLGHLLLEGRYYYGLGNIYGASKKDYFGKSNHSVIEVRLCYMINLKKTKVNNQNH